MTEEQLIQEFKTVENTFNEAVVSNNIKEISKCISSDWFLVDAQSEPIKADEWITNICKKENG